MHLTTNRLELCLSLCAQSFWPIIDRKHMTTYPAVMESQSYAPSLIVISGEYVLFHYSFHSNIFFFRLPTILNVDATSAELGRHCHVYKLSDPASILPVLTPHFMLS